MDNTAKELRKSILLREFDSKTADDILKSVNYRLQTYDKNEQAVLYGEKLTHIGIVVEGVLNILKTDYSGNETIVARIESGEMFAEAFAFGDIEPTVSVRASEKSDVVWIECSEILKNSLLTQKMMRILAKKNAFLTGRISHLSKRTLREKIMAYLTDESVRHASNEFKIPFDRQGMADYLAADRSAVSAVLSDLKRDGVIDFHKNSFKLLKF